MSTPDSQPSKLPEVQHAPWLPLTAAPESSLGSAHGEIIPGVIDLRRVFAALVRFKWVVILVPVLGTAAGVFLSRRLGLNYTTHATLWVDVPDIRARDQGPIQTPQLVG